MSNTLATLDLRPHSFGPNGLRGGVHAEWRFANGYGASVIRDGGSYGTELAVLVDDGSEVWPITYATPVTADVIGWIADETELLAILRRIASLPPVPNHARVIMP